MMLGLILAVSSGGLFWRSFTERRLLGHYGYAVLSLAVMFSAFRRFVYSAHTLYAQVGLDWIVCSIFFLGAMILVVDRVMERRYARLHGLPIVHRRGSWLLLPAMLIFVSASSWNWSGEGSLSLSYEQTMAALDRGMHVPAAAKQAKLMADACIDRLQHVVETGNSEEVALALLNLRSLKSKLEKMQ